MKDERSWMRRTLVMAALMLAAAGSAVAGQPKTPCDRVDGGTHLLTDAMRAALASRYRSYQVRRQCLADLTENTDLDPKALSVTSGDYDDDGHKDVAVLLESKPGAQAGARVIIVAFLSSRGGSPVYAGEGNGYVSSNAKGDLGHNWDLEQDFTFQRDAIFTGDFHCCGYSLIFVKGRFIRITTSD